MYEFKKNKETKKWELVFSTMNIHSSIIGKGILAFDSKFTKEYAKYEFFKLSAKIDNSINDKDDEEKYKLLKNHFGFDSLTETYSIPRFSEKEYQQLNKLLATTLWAHGVLFENYGYSEKSERYAVKTVNNLTLGLNEFYSVCRQNIIQLENGDITIEKAIEEIKPYYKKSCDIINHDAVEDICKKWTESTKEKCVRAFCMGLLNRYKISRHNRIKKDSPLKSQVAFEKYFAMWLVTEGRFVASKTKQKDTMTLETLINKH